MIRTDRHTYKVFNQDFTIDRRFQVTKELGHGAYGIVCAAKYTGTPDGPGVAIKKVTNIFSKKILCKRALRELKLLNHFRGHKNITCLYDMDIVDTNNFNELYLYEGLKYIHSANVLHRDLKPGNLLVNADCELKICDFGLARGYSSDPDTNAGFLTEYVATRWYRAPEIMLSFQSYTKAIDIWSVGCILAELLGGKPFFKGRDYVDQLNQILHYLGTPSEETLSRIGSQRAQDYVRSLPYMPKIPFGKLFPNANPQALDLLERMLAFDPSDRINVEEALEHPYLKIWHDPADEPTCPTTFDFSFEEADDMETMKQMILDEVISFRNMVRRPQSAEYDIRGEHDASKTLQQQQQQQQQPRSNVNQPSSKASDQGPPEFVSPQVSDFQHSALSSTDPLGIPEDQYRNQDPPPKPQENIRSDDVYDILEQDLEFGLDGGRLI